MSEILASYLDKPDKFDPLEGHPDPERLILDSATQAALLAGREKPFAWEVDGYLSEAALHRYRAIADIEALIHLAECGPDDIKLEINLSEDFFELVLANGGTLNAFQKSLDE